MPRYGMLVDVTKCNGCYNCFIACKDEYCGIGHSGYSAPQPLSGQDWMRIICKERGQFPKVKVDYIALPCLQCEQAPCVTASANGAVYQRADGIVVIDPGKAKGQKDLVSACPYRRIYWNEEEQVAQKCTFCAHLLDQGWKEPRCVEACPTGALVFGDLDDPQSEVARAYASQETEVLHPEYEAGEKVRHHGLPKTFVAGTVVFADVDECAAGVTVTLVGQDCQMATQTDAFGDFEFDGLPAGDEYHISVAAPGYVPRDLVVNARASLYLGDIFLGRLA